MMARALEREYIVGVWRLEKAPATKDYRDGRYNREEQGGLAKPIRNKVLSRPGTPKWVTRLVNKRRSSQRWYARAATRAHLDATEQVSPLV